MEKLEAYKLYYEENQPYMKPAMTDCFDEKLTFFFDNYKRAVHALEVTPMDGISREADAALLTVFALRAGLRECIGWISDALQENNWYSDFGGPEAEYKYSFLNDTVAKEMSAHLEEKYEKPLHELDESLGFSITGGSYFNVAGSRMKVYKMIFGDWRHPDGVIAYPFLGFSDRYPLRYTPVLEIQGDVLEFPEDADKTFRYILQDNPLGITHLDGVQIYERIPMDWYIFTGSDEWGRPPDSEGAKNKFLFYSFDTQESWYRNFMGLPDEDSQEES